MCTHSIQLADGTMYVAISAAGAFRSENGGESWTPINKSVAAEFMPDPYPEVGQCVHKLLVHPKRPQRLWQQNHCGVYRSDDRGDNWERLDENGLPTSFGFPLALDPEDPDVSLVLHLAGEPASLRAGLFLDLAGDPLHRRGYRVAMTDAPLKETLAAAVLMLGGLRDERAAALPFVDPMGGSGTLAIEQALAARDVAPGLRRRFGFQRWPPFAGALESSWRALLEDAHAQAAAGRARPLPAPIIYADIDGQALAAARRNAAAAGVEPDIQFQPAGTDVGDLKPRWPAGNVCTNPPYGERQDLRDLDAIYRRLATAFRRLAGWGVVVLSGHPQLAREMRIKPRITHRLFNGPLEVRLLRYEIGAAPDRL